MSTKQQKSIDIPLDEYIARMNITSNTPKSPKRPDLNSEPSNNINNPVSSSHEIPNPTTQESSSTTMKQTSPKVSFRNRYPNLRRVEEVRSRYGQPSATIDARQRIQQLQNRRRLGRRFFFEPQEDFTVGPSRPSIAPPSSMLRQAVVTTGPSWEQMLPFEQLQEMATSAYVLSSYFQLAPPPPFNDPALFRR